MRDKYDGGQLGIQRGSAGRVSVLPGGMLSQATKPAEAHRKRTKVVETLSASTHCTVPGSKTAVDTKGKETDKRARLGSRRTL